MRNILISIFIGTVTFFWIYRRNAVEDELPSSIDWDGQHLASIIFLYKSHYREYPLDLREKECRELIEAGGLFSVGADGAIDYLHKYRFFVMFSKHGILLIGGIDALKNAQEIWKKKTPPYSRFFPLAGSGYEESIAPQ